MSQFCVRKQTSRQSSADMSDVKADLSSYGDGIMIAVNHEGDDMNTKILVSAFWMTNRRA